MFKIDLHVHSVLGGASRIKPQEIVLRALEAGLDAVCVTEHYSYSLSERFEEISRNRVFLYSG